MPLSAARSNQLPAAASPPNDTRPVGVFDSALRALNDRAVKSAQAKADATKSALDDARNREARKDAQIRELTHEALEARYKLSKLKRHEPLEEARLLKECIEISDASNRDLGYSRSHVFPPIPEILARARDVNHALAESSGIPGGGTYELVAQQMQFHWARVTAETYQSSEPLAPETANELQVVARTQENVAINPATTSIVAEYLTGKSTDSVSECAKRGDLSGLKEALARTGWSVDSLDGDGYSPLMWAALGGHSKVVQYLLDSGAPVRTPNARTGHESPLFLAAQEGHVEVVKLLLRREEPNWSRADGQTPLIAVLMNSRLGVLRQEAVALLLIGRGAGAGADKDLALLLAASSGSVQVVMELLERGANIRYTNVDGWTVLSIAAREGNIRTATYVLKVEPALIDQPTTDGKTPLMHAAEGGNSAVVDMLVEAGANAALRDNSGHMFMYYQRNAAFSAGWIARNTNHSEGLSPALSKWEQPD